MEGTLLGVLGAVLATMLLWAAFAAWKGSFAAQATGVVDAGALAFLHPAIVAGLVLGGAAIGFLGGALAARGAR